MRGLDALSAVVAMVLGEDIMVVGGNIIRSKEVTAATKAIRKAIDHAQVDEKPEHRWTRRAGASSYRFPR